MNYRVRHCMYVIAMLALVLCSQTADAQATHSRATDLQNGVLIQGDFNAISQGQALSGEAYVGPPKRVVLDYTASVPNMPERFLTDLEAAKQCLSNLPGPPTPVDHRARAMGYTPVVPPSTITGEAAAAPGDFMIYRSSDLDSGAPSGYTSVVGEPAVGNNGNLVFQTGNWYASLSQDAGKTFKFISPYTQFPSSYGGFCCDQDVVFDPSYGTMIWLLMYVKDGSGNNALRLAAANGQANLKNGYWTYWDLTPQQLGLASGRWYDYPHMALGHNKLYICVNVFDNSDSFTNTVILRIPLSALAASLGFGYNFYNVTDRFNFTPVQGADTTIYWATHNTTSSIRIYRWDESSGSIFWDDVAHTAYTVTNRGSAHCPGPDAKDWCGRFDDRILCGWIADTAMGFMWNVAEGGGFTYPYTRMARFRIGNRALISEPIVYNPSYAWVYPSVGVNARGHLGGSIFVGGGPYYPMLYVWIADDYNSGTLSPLTNAYVIASSSGPAADNWGDYLRSRPHSASPNTWIATGYSLQGGGMDANSRPRFVWFGRGRDNPIGSVTITGVDVSTPLLPGTALNPIMRLSFSSIAGSPVIDTIRVSRTCDASDIDVPTVRLFRDMNKNDIVDGGDVLLSGQTFSGGSVVFAGLSYTASASENLLLTYDVSAGANTVKQVGASISSGDIIGDPNTILTFGGFSTVCSPLPLQLASFSGQILPKEGVQLSWSTLSEVNNYGFYIERKLENDGTFKSVSPFIPGAGTTLEQQFYTWTDTVPAAGTFLYRLRQISLDGNASYSSVIRVAGVLGVAEQAPRVFQVLQNYPEPFNPATTIKFSVEKPQHATLIVYNMLGQQVATLFNGMAEPGVYYSIHFDASSYGSGMYIYRLVSENHTVVKKMLYLR